MKAVVFCEKLLSSSIWHWNLGYQIIHWANSNGICKRYFFHAKTFQSIHVLIDVHIMKVDSDGV